MKQAENSFRVLVYWVANDFNVVSLSRAGAAAAKLYKRIQYGSHIGNTFGERFYEVSCFARIVLQIVELQGFIFAAIGPAT